MSRKNTRWTAEDVLKLAKGKPELEKSIAKQIFRTIENPKEFVPVVGDEKVLSEQQIQAAYFSWVLHPDNLYLFPLLKLIFAIPNGTNKNPYQRKLHREAGLISGVPDLQIAVSRKPYFGMFIEIKTFKAFKMKNHNCSETQLDWHERLRGQGYKILVGWSVKELIRETKDYLGYL